MDNDQEPESQPMNKVTEYMRMIETHMETSGCSIPGLILFCAEKMAELHNHQNKRKNKKNKSPE